MLFVVIASIIILYIALHVSARIGRNGEHQIRQARLARMGRLVHDLLGQHRLLQ